MSLKMSRFTRCAAASERPLSVTETDRLEFRFGSVSGFDEDWASDRQVTTLLKQALVR
jgi:hypothetical protein